MKKLVLALLLFVTVNVHGAIPGVTAFDTNQFVWDGTKMHVKGTNFPFLSVAVLYVTSTNFFVNGTQGIGETGGTSGFMPVFINPGLLGNSLGYVSNGFTVFTSPNTNGGTVVFNSLKLPFLADGGVQIVGGFLTSGPGPGTNYWQSDSANSIRPAFGTNNVTLSAYGRMTISPTNGLVINSQNHSIIVTNQGTIVFGSDTPLLSVGSGNTLMSAYDTDLGDPSSNLLYLSVRKSSRSPSLTDFYATLSTNYAQLQLDGGQSGSVPNAHISSIADGTGATATVSTEWLNGNNDVNIVRDGSFTAVSNLWIYGTFPIDPVNYARLREYHTGTSLVFDLQSGGTSGPPASVNFQSNGIQIAQLDVTNLRFIITNKTTGDFGYIQPGTGTFDVLGGKNDITLGHASFSMHLNNSGQLLPNTPTMMVGGSGVPWSNVYTKTIIWTNNLIDTFGTGSPETHVTADPGSTYRNVIGGAGTSFYVKESGTGNTGWIGK